ncbi:acyl-CoA thioesterase [Streptococcus sp. zg-86]|uniref:Acyl-CoA thioesterase n=1 Tax=Streptococcus zhangguiae TaxID=2664091 RepID=A0A6I4RIX2_9STRE|nr:MULTISPECIES: acyl-CoA thioester hydrolase/BAAT C-terminal domain-containing protein [unclassified Streptococcus]MTB64466.1 acyl-CoA thioesterase [Streptococcus sp. zg-86]MTB90844.1 acyl-CoA thioesterase [Streptococcus sp. zg-36]MWV56453.1 acyl-CoA thioesterase [Streptococcus sp. zg-70]QTH47340.1 acyl-CoA thioesterase [Streptococcus sp. zg-86]
MKRFLLGLVVVVLTGILSIVGLRMWNDRQYQQEEMESLSHYRNPQDISLYNTTIEGVTVEHIEGNYLNGFSLKPKLRKHEGVIVTFGGSEGSPAYERAVMLAQNSYRVLALFFFGMPNQQETLVDVPVEYYEEMETYIRKDLGESGPITLIGASKGAEYSLLLASLYDSIDHVVAYAPSSYVFAGLDFQNISSSWSQAGKPIPYVDMTKAGSLALFWDFVTKSPISYLKLYQTAVDMDEERAMKRIPIEKAKADIVLFAGGDDQVWESGKMVEEIKARRPDKTMVHLYPEAGHIFVGNGVADAGGMYMKMGGTEKANREAREDSDRRLLSYLASWHAPIENQ